MPHHPEITIELPEESDCLLLLSASVGKRIRERHGDEIARNYYDEAKWAKNWATLVKVIREWVTTN